MSKKELVSQLTALVEGYTEGLRSANNRLFNSIQRERVEKQEWAQKYHMVMTDNKGLEEQNGILQEKAASLATLNETLATESQNWQGQCAELRWKYSSVLKELAEKESSWSKAFAAAEKRHEERKKEITKLEYQVISAEERYQDLQDEFEASKKRQVEYHKKAENILATMGENLQKKQEQIEALTTWKEGTEEVLNSMEEKLRDYETASKVNSETIELLGTQKDELRVQLESLKQINSFQEHRIEVLAREANKLRKKEQND